MTVEANPLVSVVVVTYNHEKYIAQCLDSILNQKTRFDFEIILGEDESSDKTRDICLRYANEFPNKINLRLQSRKNVVYYKDNPTGRYNFIDCYNVCKGKYIAFCEGDDYWLSNDKLQNQVDFLEENPSYGFTFHYANIYYENTKESIPFHKKKPILEGDVTEILRGVNFVPSASLVFRKSKKAFPPVVWSLPYLDLFLQIHSLDKTLRYKCFEEYWSVYRFHDGGTHSSMWNDNKKIHQALAKSLDFWETLVNSDYLQQEDVAEAFQRSFNRIIHASVNHGDIKSVLKYLRMSSRRKLHYPWGMQLVYLFRALKNRFN